MMNFEFQTQNKELNVQVTVQCITTTLCQDTLIILQILTVVLAHVGCPRQAAQQSPIQVGESPNRPANWRWLNHVVVRDEKCLPSAQSHVFVILFNEAAPVILTSLFLNEKNKIMLSTTGMGQSWLHKL